MIFHFAWVDPGRTSVVCSFAREDKQALSFEIRHGEGDFASLRLEVRNPRDGLLSSRRKPAPLPKLSLAWQIDRSPHVIIGSPILASSRRTQLRSPSTSPCGYEQMTFFLARQIPTVLVPKLTLRLAT